MKIVDEAAAFRLREGVTWRAREDFEIYGRAWLRRRLAGWERARFESAGDWMIQELYLSGVIDDDRGRAT